MPPKYTEEQRLEAFLSRIAVAESGCWEWTGNLSPEGYGRVSDRSAAPKTRYAHRIAYELWIGVIPPGKQLDHLCRNPRCLCPEHLEAVTAKENLRRGTHRYIVRDRCIRGHVYGEKDVNRTHVRGRQRVWHRCHICRWKEMRA